MKKTEKPLKTGLVGCGAMGSFLALALRKEFGRATVLTGVCDHHEENRRKLLARLKTRCPAMSLEGVLRSSELILEAASQDAACELLTHPLAKGKTFLIMSVGGILKALARQPGLLKKFEGRILVPSGALAGVDGLLAAREAGLVSVTLKTRKPPAALKGAPYFASRKFPALKGTREVCLFRGSAAAAVKAFPQNINVAAVLSLSGLGAARTSVELWTSRAFKGNQHEVLIRHKSGQLRMVADNEPSKDNPKTSALAIYAALACLRKYFDSLKMGT